MKRIILTFVVVVTVLTLTACGHEHIWADATCQVPKTCTECGVTEGEVLEHSWAEATCTAPKTCSVCGTTEGDVLEHYWNDATCANPKTCAGCGKTEGETLEHSWVEATCQAPKTCSVCSATEGEALAHNLTEATYYAAPICTVCGETVGTKLAGFFEKNGYKLSKQGVEYDFVAHDDTGKEYPTAKVKFSNYRVVSSEDGLSYKEGYEWRMVDIILTSWSDVNFGTVDYYNGEVIKLNGGGLAKYYNGDWRLLTSKYKILENASEKAIIRMYSQMPIGYDGVVVMVADPYATNKVNSFEELVSKSTPIFFRLA